MAGIQRLFDFVSVQKFYGMPRILAKYDVRAAERLQSAESNIFQIADGRRYKINHFSSFFAFPVKRGGILGIPRRSKTEIRELFTAYRRQSGFIAD